MIGHGALYSRYRSPWIGLQSTAQPLLPLNAANTTWFMSKTTRLSF